MSAARRIAIAAGLLALVLAPSALARDRDPAAVEAFFLFLQGAGSQRAARFCERGIPGYRERFDPVFARWTARHRTRIERGEGIFHEALAEKDRPSTDYAKLEDIAKALAELKEPPRDTSPIAADDGMRRTCEAIITDLEAALAQ